MCGICGFYSYGSVRVLDFINLCIRTLERGRDGFGFAISDGERVIVRKYTNMQGIEAKLMYDIPKAFSRISKPVWGIANARAEPTTEVIWSKDSDATQPFCSGNVYVVHNGIIANDKFLKTKYDLESKYDIDTEILADFLNKTWNRSFSELKRILMWEVIGSYSLAIATGEDLYLATNYKPLCIKYSPKDNTYYFASLKHHFNYKYDRTVDNFKFDNSIVEDVRPYSIIHFSTCSIEEDSLWISHDNNRVIVIASGGLDSTTVATKYVREGRNVMMLHVLYGCRAERKEREAVEKIADYLDCKLEFVDLSNIFKNIESPLLQDNEYITSGIPGAEFAYEWVPCRNLIMLSVVSAIAETKSYNVIALGNNLEESGAYPDNEWIFTHRFNQILPYSTNLQKRVVVEMPLANMMKHEIVKLGLSMKAPYHLTWSCYNDYDKHCGNCGPCYMRMTAFRMNGVIDPVLEHVSGFWEGCKSYWEVVK